MPIYSYSKITTFEKCPLKFKYRYIDKIIPEIEKSIEAFLGEIVHETLEWLYLEINEKRVPAIDEVITHYGISWKNNFSDKILLNKKEEGDYFNIGVKFILDYYTEHYPFDDNTIGIEEKIEVDLDELGEYKIIGYIDRLSHNKEKDEYEIHDYKTGNNLPYKDNIENDKQLALYSIAIKNNFGKEKNVVLIWHYLAFNKKILLRKTNEELEQLKKDIIEIIKRIEATENYPGKKSPLCNWCEYRDICTEFGN
jgi:putative RecB family exonuclease